MARALYLDALTLVSRLQLLALCRVAARLLSSPSSAGQASDGIMMRKATSDSEAGMRRAGEICAHAECFDEARERCEFCKKRMCSRHIRHMRPQVGDRRMGDILYCDDHDCFSRALVRVSVPRYPSRPRF